MEHSKIRAQGLVMIGHWKQQPSVRYLRSSLSISRQRSENKTTQVLTTDAPGQYFDRSLFIGSE